MHANVKSSKFWHELRQTTSAIEVTMATCALLDGYPQKLEDFLDSPRTSSTSPLGVIQLISGIKKTETTRSIPLF